MEYDIQDSSGGYCASRGQQRLLAIQNGEQCGQYLTQAVLELTGRIDCASIKAAVEELCQRHEILRTDICQAPAGNAVQVIADIARISWSEHDYGCLAARDCRRALDALRRQERREPFSSSGGCHLRVALARLGERCLVLVITIPALRADGGSMQVLAQQLAQICGVPGAGNIVTSQYADLAAALNDFIESEEMVAGRRLWQRLEPPPEAQACPAILGFPRSSMTSEPEHLSTTLPFALVRPVETLSAELQVPIAACLEAAWTATAYRISDTASLIAGSCCDRSAHVELADAVGLFAKVLPIGCTDLDSLTFADWVREFQASRSKLAELADYCDPTAPVRSNPATDDGFGFSFAYCDLTETYSSGDIAARIRHLGSTFERAEFALTVEQRPDKWTVTLVHPAGLRRRAAAVLRAFKTLLAAAVRNPRQAIGELPLVTDVARITKQGLGPVQAVDGPSTLHGLFEAQAQRVPDAVAVEFRNRRWTFRELDQSANRLARYLIAHGIGPESRVGIQLDRSPEFVISIIAVLKAGAAYVPLDPAYHPDYLAGLVRQCAASAVIGTGGHGQGCRRAGTLLVDLTQDAAAIARQADAPPSVPVSPGNLAYVIFTSGSSGRPKGVMVPHSAVVNYLAWCRRAYARAGQEISLFQSSIGFDFSITPLFLPLMLGQPVRLIPEDGGVLMLADEMKSGKRTAFLKLTPSHVRLLDRILDHDQWPRSVGLLVIGGEALSADTIATWRKAAPSTQLVNEYGPTETTVGCSAYFVGDGDAADGAVPIGDPIANTRLLVLDEGLNPVLPGMSGELYVGGHGLCRGYLGQPAQTAARLIPDPFSDCGERLYRTGDRVRRRADGTLIFEGRVDRQVKINGVRVEPAEVEAAIATHPAIATALVVPGHGPGGTQMLTAYLVAKNDNRVSRGDISAHAAARLAGGAVPAAYVWLDEMPLNRNGKIDVGRLPGPDRAANVATGRTIRKSDTEEILAAIWERTLGIAAVSADDNYFALGGDSIMSIQIAAQARARGITIDVADIFAHPVLHYLAEFADLASARTPLLPTAPFSLLSHQDRARVPAGAEDAYPLTRLQAGMIFHQQLHPAAGVYHDIFSYHLTIPVNLDAMRISVAALAERHPALRTFFDLHSYSEPVQLVLPTAPSLLTVEDVSRLSAASQDDAVRAWIATEKARGFNLATGPLARFHVHKRSETSAQLTFSFHHCILDGWSDAVILTELFEHYFALLEGLEHRPLAPRFRHCEYVALERQALNDAENRRYWRDLLADRSPLRLSAGAPRAGREQIRKVVDLAVDIPEQLSIGVRNLAAALAVPVKTALLAVHLRVLAHISGHSDVITCLVSNGRPERLDGERAVGLFIGTLPFRTHLTGGTWKQLIERTFAAERESLPHRWFPLAEMAPEAAGEPPSPALFYFTHYHIFEGLNRHPKIQVLDTISHEVTSFPFVANFSLEPGTQRLLLRLAYDSTLISSSRADAIGQAYLATLTAMSTDPDARYDASCLLAPAERRRLLQRACSRDLARPAPPATQVIAEVAVRTPDAVAVVCGARQITYRDLDAHVSALACRLRAEGIGVEDVVAIALDRGLLMLIAYLAVMRAGAIVLPLEPSSPPNRTRAILDDAGAEIVVTDRKRELCEPFRRTLTIAFEDLPPAGEPPATAVPFGAPSADAGAYLCYTSGSTGGPKGVLVPHRALSNIIGFMADELAFTPDDTLVAATSIGFDIAALELLLPLTTGGKLVIDETTGGREPARLIDLLDRHRATAAQATPTTWRLLIEQRWAPPSTLRVLCGGEAMDDDLSAALRDQGAPLWNLYGPTETTVWSTSERVPARANGISLGHPIRGTRLYLLDSLLQLVPDGVPGEIYIAGAGLARCYLGQPAWTAKRFVPDPFASAPGERMYRTGDIARYVDDGRLEFLGRQDHQIKLRGFRVELGEVERALLRFPGVTQAAAVVARANGHHTAIQAYVVVSRADAADIDELMTHLRSELPDQMIPSHVDVLDRFPLTSNGKVDRNALSAARREVRLVRPNRAPPHSILGRAIAVMLADLTGQADIAGTDDLHSLGVDSLKIVRFKAQLGALLAVDVALPDLFGRRTVSDIEALVRIIGNNDEQLDWRAGLLVKVSRLSEQEAVRQLEIHESSPT